MMKTPLVSVIIPNYNHAKYLPHRIESVINQSYSNFEVIILDDKSPDNSVEVIEKYRDNPHISHIVINEKNSGSTFLQWEKGISLAAGEIIWIAESDDYCDRDFLGKLVCQYLKVPDCVVAYCSSEYVDADERDLGTYSEESSDLMIYNGERFIQEKMAYGCAIWNASAVIFSKKAALQVDKSYMSYKACGDKLFWIHMAELGKVVHLNEILNYFRQHQNKVSPQKAVDGTSLREEKRIFDYQCGKGYLKGIRMLFIESLYYNKIKGGEFNTEQIREELLLLWRFNSVARRISIWVSGWIYQHYRIYLCRKRAL